ncbi:DNA-3-methyladenine glycosylase II [Methylophilus rhizosphaerae]|uniref:DNA-3-methyladenine glycosylase II n=1 Tax=Methylophilus rhizosphaerae TaxID=492660 RepID=A0A1G8Z684_9PROT|nr:DNA-3-methyladenine glycosylase 2 [Methylophilus rhizosphaerae]SDK10144.1 DNA-3-methyladenine glycosylase II [Methylophilus rhizosphaerae]
MHIQATMPLPAGFRPQDFLLFHGRDKQEVSERITPDALQKAIVLKGYPALLGLKFSQDKVHYTLDVDNAQVNVTLDEVHALIRHILGFNQAIEIFEQAYAGHPFIGRMVTTQSGLRVPVSVSPYEAVTWAILAQQISLSAATALRRKFIQLVDLRHSSGLYCYPSAELVSGLLPERLREAGISHTKATALIQVSQQVVSGDLPLNAWLQTETPSQEIAHALSGIKGIGPWTINYTLLRGYGWLDGSLHGDAAVRRAIRGLMVLDELSEKEAARWLQTYQPWRALLAAHLWAWQHALAQQL